MSVLVEKIPLEARRHYDSLRWWWPMLADDRSRTRISAKKLWTPNAAVLIRWLIIAWLCARGTLEKLEEKQTSNGAPGVCNSERICKAIAPPDSGQQHNKKHLANKIQKSNKQVKQQILQGTGVVWWLGYQLPHVSCCGRNPSSLGSYATETVSHGRLA